MASDVYVVKVPLRVIGWKGVHLDRLEELVKLSHKWVTHAYQFARYILLNELHAPPKRKTPFNLAADVNKQFFLECLLQLTDAKQRKLRKDPFRPRARLIVAEYLTRYKVAAQLGPPFSILAPGQLANFEATSMMTAYSNGVKNNFGNMLRHVVNVLTGAHERARAIRQRMRNQPENDIRDACDAQVWMHVRVLRESLQFLRPNDRMTPGFTFIVRQQLQPFFDAYGPGFELPEEGIYYHVKAHPIEHLHGYYELARILQQNDLHSFQCFPLWTGWIPAHITLDTTIARRAILELTTNPADDFRNTWAQIVNLSSKPFHQRNGCSFGGTIITNGVTASILKVAPGYKRGKKPRTTTTDDDDDDTAIPYISELTREQLEEIKESSVYIDPGRRQLIHAMGHGSTSVIPQLFRTTFAERMSQMHLCEYNKIRENLKTSEVLQAEQDLSTVNCRTLDPDAYNSYIGKRALHWDTLFNFYANTMTTAPKEDGQHKWQKRHQQQQQKWIQRGERQQQQQQQEHQRQIQEKQRNGRLRQQLLQEEWQEQLPMKRGHGETYRQCKADLHLDPGRSKKQQEQELKDFYWAQQKELEELKETQSKDRQRELQERQQQQNPVLQQWQNERQREQQDERQQQQQEFWQQQQQQYRDDRHHQRKNRRRHQRVRRQQDQEHQQQNIESQRMQKRAEKGKQIIKRDAEWEAKWMAKKKSAPTNEQYEEREELRKQKIEDMKAMRGEQKNRRQQRQQELQDQRGQRQKEESERGLLPRRHPWSTQPLHRKLQESAYINCQRTDAKVARDLRRKFGLNPTLIIGNWSAGMVRHQSPIPGKGLRRMLLSHGFRVLHIDEFKTSTWCPYCGVGRLQKFLDVDNPRPHRRAEVPVIQSHAVLRCNNAKCEGRVVNSTTGWSCPRILNRDLAACMNFRHIVDGLREHGSVPERFMRPRRTGNVPVAAPDDGPPARRQRTE